MFSTFKEFVSDAESRGAYYLCVFPSPHNRHYALVSKAYECIEPSADAVQFAQAGGLRELKAMRIYALPNLRDVKWDLSPTRVEPIIDK